MCADVQDDESYDSRSPRTTSSQVVRGVGGQCITVKVHYLHHSAYRSALFVGVALGSIVQEQGHTKLVWATKSLAELKVCMSVYMHVYKTVS